MGKFVKILFNCLLVLIILVLLSYFALRLADKIMIYNVETGSMEDKIHSGDYLLLYKKTDYHIGDVITYKVDSYFVTHRIIKIEDGKIITKGDANNEEDEGINQSQVVGKAIYWGGVLNFVINFKFAIVAFLIGLYLLSCYFEDEKKEKLDGNINVENTSTEEEKDEIGENEEVLEEGNVVQENSNEDLEKETVKEENKEEIKAEEIIIEDIAEEKVEENILEENKEEENIKNDENKIDETITQEEKADNKNDVVEEEKIEEKEEIKPKRKKASTTKMKKANTKTKKKSTKRKK